MPHTNIASSHSAHVCSQEGLYIVHTVYVATLVKHQYHMHIYDCLQSIKNYSNYKDSIPLHVQHACDTVKPLDRCSDSIQSNG